MARPRKSNLNALEAALAGEGALMNGYLMVYCPDTLKTVGAHRVIYEAFKGPIPMGYDVHHLDGNRLNNAPENLQALSRKEHFQVHGHVLSEYSDGFKKCPICGEFKDPENDFYAQVYAGASGLAVAAGHRCKVCQKKVVSENRRKRKEAIKQGVPVKTGRPRKRLVA